MNFLCLFFTDRIRNRTSTLDYLKGNFLVRPSYVLSGAAMNVCHDDEELRRFLEAASEVSKEYPVVISQFMTETNEIEFDGVAQNGEIVEYGISASFPHMQPTLLLLQHFLL